VRLLVVALATCCGLLPAGDVSADCTWLLFPDTQYYAFPGDPAPQAYLDYTLALEGGSAPLSLVMHPGDVVDYGFHGAQADRYAVWSTQFERLSGVPYAVAFGNHDGSPGFADQFGASTDQYPTRVATFDDRNYAVTFACDGIQFLLVNLEYDPNEVSGLMEWAEDLIEQRAQPTVLLTHAYGHQTRGRSVMGDEIFGELVEENDLILAVFSGHLGERAQVVQNESGSDVLEMMANYQFCNPDGLGDVLVCRDGPNAGAACLVDGDCPNGACLPQFGYGQGFVRPITVSVDSGNQTIAFGWQTPNVLEGVVPDLTPSCPTCNGCPDEDFHTAGSVLLDVSSRLSVCSDGLDNDGDGLIDAAQDPGCTNASDRSEVADCADGLDNDGDGDIDQDDGGCDSASDHDEHSPALVCDDGLDNDADGSADYAEEGGDPGCADTDDGSEQDSLLPCDDGLDDDGDGLIDSNDPGCTAQDDDSEQSADLDCDDGLDNDGDGMIDTADPGCGSPAWKREDPQCQDGLDNDGNARFDFDGGLSHGGGWLGAPDTTCTSYPDYFEGPISGCGLGAELVLLAPLFAFLKRRRRSARS
jgi:hypothetical protein